MFKKDSEIGLIVSPNPKAAEVAAQLMKIYPAKIVSVNYKVNMPVVKSFQPYKHITRFVAVGGDGACLKALRIAYDIKQIKKTNQDVRVFGLNCGHIGALSNCIGNIQNLSDRFQNASYRLIKPLEIKTTFREKIVYHTFFNEVILRPYANITHLKIVWQDKIWYEKNIRGGLMVATKIGETAMNACNYTDSSPILPIPDDSYWRMSTLNAMPNDPKYDKPFQAIVPNSTSIAVDVMNPYDDRNAQIMGDSYYNEGEEDLHDRKGYKIGSKVKMLFVDKLRIATAVSGVLLGREKE